MNEKEFRKMLIDNDSDIEAVREILEIKDRETIKLKVRGDTDFKQSEIAKIKNHFNLTPEDVDRIFFTV